MADYDPNLPLSEFDLADLPKEDQAKVARARAAAIGKQRDWAVLQMMAGDVSPELGKTGAAQLGQANEDQRALESQGGHVLNRALQQKQYEKELAALQQQIEYQRGQLGLQTQQLGLEGQRLNLSVFAPFLAQALSAQGKVNTVGSLADLFHLAGSKLESVAKTPAEAQLKAIQDVFGMAQTAKEGGTPKAPTHHKGQGAAPAPAAPTHYAYSPDRKQRMPLGPDGKPLGPPEAVP